MQVHSTHISSAQIFSTHLLINTFIYIKNNQWTLLSSSDKVNKTKIMSREKKITKYARHTVSYYLLNCSVPILFLGRLLIRHIMLFEWDNGEQWEFSSPLGIIATCLTDIERTALRRWWKKGKHLRGIVWGSVLQAWWSGTGFVGSEA